VDAINTIGWTTPFGFTDDPGPARCEIATFHKRVLQVAARIPRVFCQLHFRVDATWRCANASTAA